MADSEHWMARYDLERERTISAWEGVKTAADRGHAAATHAEESAKQHMAALEDMCFAFCNALSGLHTLNE